MILPSRYALKINTIAIIPLLETVRITFLNLLETRMLI